MDYDLRWEHLWCNKQLFLSYIREAKFLTVGKSIFLVNQESHYIYMFSIP